MDKLNKKQAIDRKGQILKKDLLVFDKIRPHNILNLPGKERIEPGSRIAG